MGAVEEEEEQVRFKGNTLAARIWVLIGNGQFVEAEALIAEGTAAGLLSKPQATRMLEKISQLNTRLGDIPASVQRAPDFPSQLKDYTLFEIDQMLQRQDFSIAAKAQLMMAKKLIKEFPRLLAK
ncbi:MAG TPA: hypothetical protein VFZ09_40070 [Archangium sp.]|uniref:hypothetical protein n=1 Tax=Archangium sp. TaxID=1872627 RepID=UPI002E36F18E|nr:hypothetical protein [Archangium sp.]HEX5752471.1 hypothetical protein [Archangium sp.]